MSSGLDMTQGDVRRQILCFSGPLLLTNVFQIANSMLDRMWAARLLGLDALGAIAVSTQIYLVVLALAMGITLGVNVVIARSFGAGDPAGLRKAASSGFFLVLVTSLLTGGALFSLAGPVLRLAGTPEELIPAAASYLRIVGEGLFFVFALNLITFIFRGMGETRKPMRFLLLAVILNMVLDPILMGGWGPIPGFGLRGAAWAWNASQAGALLYAVGLLMKTGLLRPLSVRLLLPDPQLVLRILSLGLPASAQQLLMSLGMVAIQGVVNGFGPQAVAAFAAVGTIDNMVLLPMASLGSALMVLTGQSLGAGRPERVREGLRQALFFCFLFSAAVALACLFCPRLLLAPFLGEDEGAILGLGVSYLHKVAVPYLFVGMFMVFDSLMGGGGDTMASMVLALLNLWCLRVPLVRFLSGSLGMGVDGVWMGIAAGFVLAMVTSSLYLMLAPKWRDRFGRVRYPVRARR